MMRVFPKTGYGRSVIATLSLILLQLLTLNCSKKGSEPDSGNTPTDPIGVLLSGASGDPAVSGTTDHGPFLVPEAEIAGDFITTRLEATINPKATVGQVNSTLESFRAKISCMTPGVLFVELIVPVLESDEQAKVLCSSLVAADAFLFAFPAYISAVPALYPGDPAGRVFNHLEKAHIPAAWNARDLVAQRNNSVTVLVADAFANFNPQPEIPSLTFSAGSGFPDFSVKNGSAVGNHGFFVAAVIGARFDAVGTTGVFADTNNLLKIPCVVGLGFGTGIGFMKAVRSQFPATGKFILNSSYGAVGLDFSKFSKFDRAVLAMYWRILVAEEQHRFLHAGAAGNDGVASNDSANATYFSGWILSSRFDHPLQMLQGSQVSPDDSARFHEIYDFYVEENPLFGLKTTNTLAVGSSDPLGNESAFSNRPADVRMIGEGILVPCAVDDDKCAPFSDLFPQRLVNGTSFAAPQVAGLAAWLWSLSPELTVVELIDILKGSFNGKWIDGYKAVLSLDHSEFSAEVRRAILDVSNANGQKGSNNTFDEKDLQMYLDSLDGYEANRGGSVIPPTRDHSIFDLNGDGFTGDTGGVTSTAPFDLNVNTPPTYTTVNPQDCPDTTFNESEVTDRDILYYYAYSPLYSGDTGIRDSLLPCGVKVVALGAEYLAFADVQGITVLSFDPLATDTSIDGDRLDGVSNGDEPVSANLTANTQCGQTPVKATARLQLDYFAISGDNIAGLEVIAECTESDLENNDSLCFLLSRTAVSRCFPGFEVREKPVGFTINATTSVSSGRAEVSLTGLGQEIFNLGPNDNGGMSGELPVGVYSIGLRSSGDGKASFAITFFPLPDGASSLQSKLPLRSTK